MRTNAYPRVEAVIDKVWAKGVTFHLSPEGGSELWVQVKAYIPDSSPPHGRSWHGGRKWRLSEFMTDGEIVQTCLRAVLDFWEHESRETFTYKGVQVFDPHYDIDKLVTLRSSEGAVKGRD